MKIHTLFIATLLFAGCAPPSEKPPEPELNLSEKLELDVHKESVASAMVHLAREMEQDQEVSAFCHALTHSIGHAAYDKVGLDALLESNDLCGSGYFHGVIERHFEKSAEVLQTFKTLCADKDGRCFHGLGHGLMFATENDVPTSIGHCGELSTRAQKIQCAEGVFMENYNTNDAFHSTQYIDPENPFFPCNTQEPPYKGVCTFYAVRYYLRLHPHDHAGVLDWCGGIESDVRDSCYKGIGSALTKYHIEDTSIATSTCDTLEGNDRAVCYDGIVSYTIVHHASVKPAEDWCSTLEENLKSRCETIVEQSRDFYGE